VSLRTIIALCALGAPAALAQSTTVQTQPGTSTTVQSQPQPGTTTTVQTQPQAPSTNVVVNPPQTTSTRVVPAETPVVVEEHPRRSTLAIVASDALYGGLIGAAIGGGVALIQQDKNNWPRDLAIGGGAGLIGGAIFGAVQAASQDDRPVAHAAVDGAGNGGTAPNQGPALLLARRF
jgi:hypothetical protein